MNNIKEKISQIILITFFLLSISCSIVKNSIKNNTVFTDNLKSSVLNQNGNVFYIGTTSAAKTTIWTYNKDKLVVYKLFKSKIVFQEEYSVTGISDFSQLTSAKLFELDQCLELDGDYFGYMIKSNLDIEKYDYPISVNCFTKMSYKSRLLNKIVEDINTNKLWDITN